MLHQLPPYLTFRAFFEPELFEEIGRLCDGLIGRYTKGYVEYYSETENGGLQSS